MRPKIHGWIATQYGQRVDCKLWDCTTTTDIYWSARSNSYVLAEVPVDATAYDRNQAFPGPPAFYLASINGAGEVRWTVDPARIDSAIRVEAAIRDEQEWSHTDACEALAAARHFGLAPKRVKP